jgi:hypothetical protein
MWSTSMAAATLPLAWQCTHKGCSARMAAFSSISLRPRVRCVIVENSRARLVLSI